MHFCSWIDRKGKEGSLSEENGSTLKEIKQSYNKDGDNVKQREEKREKQRKVRPSGSSGEK
jgi:hypothetical protein